MNETVRVRLTHILLSALLTAGLLLPLLRILEPSFLSPSLLIPVILVILLFEAACFNRVSALISLGLAAVFLLIWLFAMNGLIALSDAALAVAHRFAGIRTALPLAGFSAAVMLAVLVALVSCFACLRGASAVPPAILCVGMVLLIYLSGEEAVLPLFLPALAAVLLILLTDRFPETSLLSLIPVVSILVAVSLLLTGSGIGPNPLREKADELRQAVLDRLFFTEPRDVFSLSSEGYYPEGQDQLGGKPNPKEELVMQVSTPRNVYLRGVVLNQYTGRNWQNTNGGRRYLWQSARLAAERAALFDEDLPPLSVRNSLCEPSAISVRILRDGVSTLFVPQRIRSISPGGDLVPYFSNSSELFVTRNLKAGDTYSVSAPLFVAGDPGLSTLIEVCSTLEDSRYEQMVESYTVLPPHLEEPVYALAREAASVASSPYDRALAIRSWLLRSCRYTTDVDRHPENVDFVTRFLLDTREGYCTYFASAMTVMCRMIGLPARYVEGYLAIPDENGEADVTGLSAHAWTEVYFSGFGWLTFDATPGHSGGGGGQTDPDPSPSPRTDGTLPTPAPTPVPAEEPTPDPAQYPDGQPEDQPSALPEKHPGLPEGSEPGSFPWLWLLLLLLLLALAFRILITTPSVRARRAINDADRFDIWSQDITDLLHAENLTRRKGESPMAFGRRVDRSGLFSASLGPVGECISLIRYSRAQAEESDAALLRDTSAVIKHELSRPARLRYLLRRTFIPLSRRDSL